MNMPPDRSDLEAPATPPGLERRSVLQRLMGLLFGAGPLAAMAAKRKGQPSEAAPGQPVWRPDHVVIVILENLSAFDARQEQLQQGNAPVYSGTADWRFFNQLAQGGARFTDSHFGRTPYGSALPTRPSQPNYLFLFSGHHQEVLPAWFEDTRSPYVGQALFDRQGQPLPAPGKTRIGVANANVPQDWLPFTSPNLGADDPGMGVRCPSDVDRQCG